MVATRFRQTIKLQSPPTDVDARGQISGSWTDEATRRAEVKQRSGRDREAANQLYHSANWKVVLWYDPDLSVTTDWRLTWGSKTLEIGNVLNVDEKGRIWELLCSEVD